MRTDTQREGHGTTEAETGEMQPQAKDCGPPPEAWKGQGRILPRVSEGAQPCQYLDFILLASRTGREWISTVWSHQFVVLYRYQHQEMNTLNKAKNSVILRLFAYPDLPSFIWVRMCCHQGLWRRRVILTLSPCWDPGSLILNRFAHLSLAILQRVLLSPFHRCGYWGH